MRQEGTKKKEEKIARNGPAKSRHKIREEHDGQYS